ncbi:hypothetical protein [Streptomyces globosus]|uniref:hypothetical protein n=1 Tax=Streptomyces globosus TaxID=68209 RepID=UPI00362696C8
MLRHRHLLPVGRRGLPGGADGRRCLRGTGGAPGGTPIAWQDLTNPVAVGTDPANPAYPANACAIAIEAQGDDAYVKVVTTAGTVWQTHGDVNGAGFVWDEPWVQRTTPAPVVLRGPEPSGPLD